LTWIASRLDTPRRLVLLYLAAGLSGLAGYVLFSEPWSAFSFLALSGLVVIALVVGVRVHAPGSVRPWVLLLAGQAGFLLGDLIWYSEYLPTGEAPAFPSVSDVFYLAGYPALALGVLLFIRARQPRYRLTAALDALAVGVAAVLALWLIAIEPFIYDDTLPILERAVLLAYPVGDALIMSAAAYLLLSGRQAKGAFYLLVASLGLLLAADVVYAAVGDADETVLADVLWLSSYVLFGLTALVPSMRNLTELSDAPRAPEGRARLLLLGGAMAAVPAFVVLQLTFYEHVDLWLVLIMSAVLGSAVLLRMHELVAVHRRAESRYTSLLANASDAFAIVRVDGTLTYASPASGRVLGYDSEQLAGQSALQFVDPRTMPDAADTLRRISVVPGEQEEMELRVQRGDGEWRWLSIIATNRTDDPIVNGIVLNYRDVTEQHEAQARIKLQARMLDEVQHAVIVTDPAGLVTYWNQAAETLLGWSPTEAIGRALVDLGVTATQTEAADGSLAVVRSGSRWSGEMQLQKRDAGTITALVTNSAVQDPDGHLRGVIAVAVDITERKQLEQRLHQQAFTDALTGLANRTLFLDRIDHLLAGQPRGGAARHFAVLFLDVDDFKTVNDSMGHGAGDELLVGLAHRLTRVLRPTDTAARLGGDEFAVLLEDASIEDAERVARRLLTDMRQPVPVSDREVLMSASIGIAVPAPDGSSLADELLRNADLAMYGAKAKARGTYAVYEPGMHEAAVRRLEMKADLQRAIETNGLRIEYQPIVRLGDGTAVGVEALVRWAHAERGDISATETIALAETAGLIIPLGEWVLHEACRQVRVWRDELAAAGHDSLPFVSVNASAKELLDPDYPQKVADAMARNGLPGQALAIEITESALMHDSQAAITALGRLKRLGVRLAIDDFGTGYSSLRYLARFPLDVLKVDRTFVARRTADEGWAIARSIIDLARSLGLEIVAEGIERSQEATVMASLGADYGQGYFLGRPQRPERVLAALLSPPRPMPPIRGAEPQVVLTPTDG
jgi:diguanylate cyclase (GGDEF)-like protein/PAS domain S-box-containing protein